MSLESKIAKEIRKQLKMDKLASDMHGEGVYIFENNTLGDLYLPRPTQSGRRLVRKGEQFMGDNYYFGMVRSHELKFVKEIQSPDEQRLLTEQPPIITEQGSVEHIDKKQYNENQPPTQDVLLTEKPMDGIKILR